MTSFDRFERSLPELFDELAAARTPDYFDDILTRTAATRQRPEWSFPERWVPMSAITRRFAAAPRVPWRLAAALALLIAAALVAYLVAGPGQHRVPAPFGTAANGQIAFVDATGRVVTGDVASTETHLVADVTGSESPLFSQDGGRIAFFHGTAAGGYDLATVRADGSGLTTITTRPISKPTYVGWSGAGDRILVVSDDRMLLFDVTRSGEPVALSEQLGETNVSIGNGYNFRPTHAFRPPASNEILFQSLARGQALNAVRPDGTGLRKLIDQESSPVAYSRLKGAEWSPDGSQIVLMLEFPNLPEQWHAYILEADGSNLRPLTPFSENPLGDQNSTLWSPDGTRIAFQYWDRHAGDQGQDFHPIAVVDVATGKLRDVGPMLINGATWGWSPDGQSILEVPGDRNGQVLVVDVATGRTTTAPWRTAEFTSWQRVAPPS